MSTVVVVRTGTANLASVRAAFERLGWEVELTQDPQRVRDAEKVVLPGVGAFGASMAELDNHGLRSALTERMQAGRATLCICVGMQLLCASSTESPGAVGMKLIEADVTRFEGDVRVPQLGWNKVTASEGTRFLRSGVAYFANSYRIENASAGWLTATADYSGRFVAAAERDNVLACQFHPELSGAWGAQLLLRWLEES